MIQLDILNKYIDFSQNGIIERRDAIKAMNEYAKIYHQEQVKKLNIVDVSTRSILEKMVTEMQGVDDEHLFDIANKYLDEC